MAAPGQSHANESDDLFDFPIIEVKLEPVVEAAPPAVLPTPAAPAPVASAPTPAPTPVQVATPVAHATPVAQVAPRATPVQVAPRATPVVDEKPVARNAPPAPSHVKASASSEPESEDLFDFPIVAIPVEHEAAPVAAIAPPAPMPAPVAHAAPSIAPTITPVVASTPAAHHTSPPAAAPIQHVAEPAPKRVAPAAVAPVRAVDDSAEAANDELVPQKGARRRFAGARSLWIAVGAIALLNVGGLWFVWHTHSSVGAGLETLREELDTTARRIDMERRQAVSKEHAATVAAANDPESSPVGSIERASVEIALQQLNSGEYAAARVRLQRLLAQADRMDRSVRDELEPRIVYLVAQSYYDEARVRRGVAQ